MGGPALEPQDWSLRLVTPPTAEPFTLAKAKVHLRVDAGLTEDDDWITDCIAGARAYLELAYDVKIMPQTWELRLQQFPAADRIRFPVGPIQRINSFTYQDTGGNIQSITIGVGILERLAKKPAELILPFGKVWPAVVLQTADPILIEFDAGYLSGASPDLLPMPGQIRQALYLLIDHYYNNRSAITLGTLMKSDPIALGVDSLMATVGHAGY